MKKVVLIGPVYPYKGGISHYTSLLYQALIKKYDVEMISYKMQYPRFLFKKEQKDYSNDMFKIENAQFLIHTANPINIIKVGKMIKSKNPDFVILQWWHPYFAPCYWLLTTILGKNIKKLFICHNVFPHERFPMDRKLAKMTLKKGSSYIVQSRQDEEDLKTIIKNPVYVKTVHPTYNAFRIENMSKREARKRLNLALNEKVLLFFGFVREYKGLKYLIEAMPFITKSIANVKLMIVGDFSDIESKKQYEEMILQKGITECVNIYDGYIPDKEVEKFFAACDLVVLPYISATQSGIVQISYGFEKPVVATNVGGLPDVVINGKTGYIVEPERADDIADAVVDFFEKDKEDEFAEKVRKEAYRFSWERMTEIIEDMMGEL